MAQAIGLEILRQEGLLVDYCGTWIPRVLVSELPRDHAIKNDEQQAGAQPETDAKRRKQPLFVGVALIGHEEDQARRETGDKRYHE